MKNVTNVREDILNLSDTVFIQIKQWFEHRYMDLDFLIYGKRGKMFFVTVGVIAIIGGLIIYYLLQ
jgi:hypothetical protein